MTSVLSKLTTTIKETMGATSNIDEEEQKYLQDVEAVKQWWSDDRWRFTKRPYTAESIVQKRGTIKIQYPSNDLSKKLWGLMEQRFADRTVSATGESRTCSEEDAEKRTAIVMRLSTP